MYLAASETGPWTTSGWVPATSAASSLASQVASWGRNSSFGLMFGAFLAYSCTDQSKYSIASLASVGAGCREPLTSFRLEYTQCVSSNGLPEVAAWAAGAGVVAAGAALVAAGAAVVAAGAGAPVAAGG